MPELPEVEHLRRTLEPALVGAEIVGVTLFRQDVIRGRGRLKFEDKKKSKSKRRTAPADLLSGCRIQSLVRHGKNMAIVAECGRSLCVHLGMSGQMFFLEDGQRSEKSDHIHCQWRLQWSGADSKLQNSPQSRGGRRDTTLETKRGKTGSGRLIFRDPRRFGGLWLFDSVEALQRARFDSLGPDALTITPGQLRDALAGSKRPIKAALLDQTVLAGMGNIYVDESLFMARIHPLSTAATIPSQTIMALVRSIKRVLNKAIEGGGSSIRSYRDGRGEPGHYQKAHAVYGRAGEACTNCGDELFHATVAQRTTVFCEHCQRRYRK